MWLADNQPVHQIETRYLSSDNEDDLINPSSITQDAKSSTPNDTTDQFDLKQMIVLLHLTTILLLLAFSVLPGFLPRLFLICSVAGCMGCIIWKDFPNRRRNIAGLQKLA
jgi:hypothetical protein